MSRPGVGSGRPSFASQTAFDSLPVESGEEDYSEEEEEPQVVAEHSPSEPSKPSKASVKRAAKQARQQEKQAAKQSARQAASDSNQVQPIPQEVSNVNGAQTHDSVEDEKVQVIELETPQAAQSREVESSLKPVSPHPRPRSRSPPFSPKLPAHLPEVRRESLERKRKADGDLCASNPLAKEPKIEIEGQRGSTTSVAVSVEPVSTPTDTQAEKAKKKQSIITRTVWTLIMIAGFIALLLMGHVYVILLVFACQTLVYREVTALFALTGQNTDFKPQGKDPWSKTLSWYFFAIANYYLYGETIIYYFKHVVYSEVRYLPFATSHRIISFLLYMSGFMGFVGSLKRSFLRQQFGLFCWVHMTLLLIVVSSHFIVNNILEGLIWFWVPASLVICNDVFAYIWGMTMGRTPLIALSPKKTVEGFVGAFFSTLVFGLIWGTIFMQFEYMICPVTSLGVSAWHKEPLNCKPNPVFEWREWVIPAPISTLLSSIVGKSISNIPWVPYQLHVLVLSTFASLAAPFGGFFASGFKRAFDIKDFGDSIPGHGGMTDRMDCQFLMGLFSYVYYSSLIRELHVTVGGVLQTVVSGLTVEEQLQLFGDLKHYLRSRGVKA